MKVLASRCLVTIIDPVTFNSTWVLKENLWAANAGIPIVAVFDADRYRWVSLGLKRAPPQHHHVPQLAPQ